MAAALRPATRRARPSPMPPPYRETRTRRRRAESRAAPRSPRRAASAPGDTPARARQTRPQRRAHIVPRSRPLHRRQASPPRPAPAQTAHEPPPMPPARAPPAPRRSSPRDPLASGTRANIARSAILRVWIQPTPTQPRRSGQRRVRARRAASKCPHDYQAVSPATRHLRIRRALGAGSRASVASGSSWLRERPAGRRGLSDAPSKAVCCDAHANPDARLSPSDRERPAPRLKSASLARAPSSGCYLGAWQNSTEPGCWTCAGAIASTPRGGRSCSRQSDSQALAAGVIETSPLRWPGPRWARGQKQSRRPRPRTLGSGRLRKSGASW
jgi:hypothetical protein